MTCIVDKTTDHTKQHFDLFFLPQYQRQRQCFLEHELKKALCNTMMRAVLSRLLSTTVNKPIRLRD